MFISTAVAEDTQGWGGSQAVVVGSPGGAGLRTGAGGSPGAEHRREAGSTPAGGRLG